MRCNVNLLVIVFVVLVVLALLVLFKFKEIRHKIVLVAISLVLVFLVFSFIQIYSIHDLDLKTFDGVLTAGKIYFSWLGNVFDNVVKSSGYIINQDWGLNVTNVSIK